MKTSLNLKIYAIIGLFILLNKASGQCTVCSATIVDNSVLSYTVTSGQTLCIPYGFSYSGTICLQGGVVCNQGSIYDLTLQSGILNNYGVIGTPGGQNETIALNGKLTINNFTGGRYTISTELIVSSSSGTDSLCLIIPKGSYINIGTNLKLNSGRLRVNVGLPETNYSPNNLNTSLTVGGDMILLTGCLFKIEKDGVVNVTGNFNLQESGMRAIANNGTLDILGNLNFVGNGLNTTTITLTNNGSFSSTFLNSSIINANVVITNNPIAPAQMLIKNSINLSNSGTIINVLIICG